MMEYITLYLESTNKVQTAVRRAQLFYCIMSWLFMVLKLGRFGQQIRNTWKVLKCGAGEGWRRSVGPIM